MRTPMSVPPPVCGGPGRLLILSGLSDGCFAMKVHDNSRDEAGKCAAPVLDHD
jgi:hypothetical protein